MDEEDIRDTIPRIQDTGPITHSRTGKYAFIATALVIYALFCALTLKSQDYRANSDFAFERTKNRLQNVSSTNKYSYATASSDSKSLVSYTDKTLWEINQMVSQPSSNELMVLRCSACRDRFALVSQNKYGHIGILHSHFVNTAINYLF